MTFPFLKRPFIAIATAIAASGALTVFLMLNVLTVQAGGVTANITASTPSVTSGGPVNIFFNSSDYSTPCRETFDPDDNNSESGSITLYPTTTTTYSVTCGVSKASVLVTVVSTPAPTITSFSANPTTVVTPGSTTLKWTSSYATSCTMTGGSFGTNSSVNTNSSSVVNPSSSTNYTLNCTGPGGSSGGSTVFVTVTAPTTAGISANYASITVGNSSALSWSSSNATSCTGSGFSTGGATSGTVSVTPSSTTNYSVTCSGSGGSQTANTIVSVGQPVPLGASCSPSTTNTSIYTVVNWVATAFGGTQPYNITWSGDDLSGGGTSQNVSYATAGTKQGKITVTDSGATAGAPSSFNWTPNYLCTGPKIAAVGQHDTEDGGNANGAEADTEANGQETYSDPTDDAASGWPADFNVNPQNYCVQGEMYEQCDPSHNNFGTGGCPFQITETLHSGTGITPTPSSYYDPYTYNGVSYTGKYLQYTGTNTYNPAVGATSKQTITNACNYTVNVTAPIASALLSANPISIVAGASSTLTWTSTNATSCSIDNGIGSVATSNTTGISVSPAVTTTYTLTCSGSTTTATSPVTITVAAAIPTTPTGLNAVCNAAGTAVTLSWTPTPNTTIYYPRMYIPTAAQCTSYGWQVYTADGKTCYPNPDNWSQTTVTNFPVTPNQNYSWWVQASNSSGVSPAAYGSVDCPGEAHLTVTADPNVSGTLGQPITVTSTIHNSGTGPTTAGFPDLFVTNLNAQATAWNTLGNTWQGVLANGASIQESYTFPANTFTAPGSYLWDACANRTTSWATVVPDSDYQTNCGPGGTITVNPPAPPIPAAPTNPQTTCSADGKSVSFSWTASANATNYYPRMYAPSAAQCNSFGWQVWTDGATCYPNPDTWTATNVANFPITPGQNYAWYVAAGNSSGINWGATTGNNSFTCVGQPDITVAAGTTVSDTVNTPITLSALVSNSPSGGAAGAFPNILQVCTDTGCSVSNVQNASGVSSLAAGASQTVTSSYTPSANGSYVYRMCGNLNTSWQNIITESNYGNNCGGWATLNVAYPAIGGTCSASPASGYAGQNVTWSAYATGGSGVYTYQWGGNVSGTSQTESQTYPSAGTYTGQVTVSSGGSNATIMCTPLSGVVIQSCNPTFTASPSTVDQGQSSTLTWSVPSSCSSSCTGSGFSTGGATSGTATVYPSAPSSSYALMCVSQPNKNVTIPVTVPSLSITANPTMASVGGATTLTWSASDVDSCSVTDSAGGTEQASASSDGSRNFTTGSPDHNIILTKSPETYTFACVSHGSTVSKSVTVNGNVKFKEF
jgi:hypothetical protein